MKNKSWKEERDLNQKKKWKQFRLLRGARLEHSAADEVQRERD